MEQGAIAGAGQPVMGVDANGAARFIRVDATGNLSNSAYPAGATPVAASATGTTAATTATLAAAAGKTTYIAGFSIDADATGAAAVTGSITGTLGGTMSFRHGVGLTPAVVATTKFFDPPIPASALNTAIAVVSGAPGAGGNITVNAWGYQL